MGKRRLYAFLLLACALGYGWLYYSFSVSTNGADGTVCIIKNTTGIPCPACGNTRSIEALLHGNIVEALFINPLGIIVFAIMALIPIWIGLDTVRKTDTLWSAYQKIEKVLRKPWVATLLIALVLVNWIWNINKGL